VNLGPEATSTPFQTSWNTVAAANGAHTLRAIARDYSNNIFTGPSISVTVSNDVAPPVISGVTASNITNSGADISWTTNEPSDTQIDYGTTFSYGLQTTLNSSLVTFHAQSLFGLAPGTLYHYRVRSRDASGNLGLSGDVTFTTFGGVPTPSPSPVVSPSPSPIFSPPPPSPSPSPFPSPSPAPSPSPGGIFSIGSRVRTTANLNVRASAGVGGTLLCTQTAGSRGTVVGGPVSANGFTWWSVDYDTNCDGWSVQDFLVLDTGGPAPSPTPSLAPSVSPGACVGRFSIGSRVRTTANLNVRATPSIGGALLGTQVAGSTGTVIGCSVFANGFTWWQIDYDTGADGWSVQDFLVSL